MRDKYLKAAMQPANYVMALWRGQHPQSWHFQNISPGYADLYATMAWADENHQHVLDCRRHIFRAHGAAVAEIAIVRPTFEEIETICA